MPMELRKRKAPVEPKDAPVAKKKVTTKTSAPKVRASKAKAKEVSEVPPVAPAAPAAPTEPTEPIEPVAPVAPVASRQIPTVGAIIDFEQYQDEVQLEDGTTTSLKALVESSKNGVVLFTYPKASTPGCTRQACLFRDGYVQVTSTGLSIYGLSSDSPSANTKFKEKQSLPFPLICDPSAKLIGAIGLKKQPKGTIRGVFAVDKSGKVLLCGPAKPETSFNLVEELVAGSAEAKAN